MYYPGEDGVRAHNTSCTFSNATEGALIRAEETVALEKGQVPCFAAGTLVRTKDGLKPIEDICVGDCVLSYPDDQRTPDRRREEQEYSYRRVTQTFITDHQPLSKLIVCNLVSGSKETIWVTANHPIYNSNRGWTSVADIKVGDVLENYMFGNLLVFRIYHDVDIGKVYNFEVDEFHTYYVGEQGVWVHNHCENNSQKYPR